MAAEASMVAGLGLVALLGLLFVIGFQAALNVRGATRAKRAAREQGTCSHWARARNQLMDLAREGKIDVRSTTFQALYHSQTFVLRRPDEYRQISAELAQVFATGQGAATAPPWAHEREGWPPEIREVLEHMAKGTGSLIFMHRGWRRVAMPLAKSLGITAVLLTRFAGQKLADRIIQPALDTYYLERTKLQMETLAHV